MSPAGSGCGGLAFHFLGFNLGALALYVTMFRLAFQLGWEIGISPSTVLVSHLLLENPSYWSSLAMSLLYFSLELALFLANLYMPSRQEAIDSYHEQVEEQLKRFSFALNTF